MFASDGGCCGRFCWSVGEVKTGKEAGRWSPASKMGESAVGDLKCAVWSGWCGGILMFGSSEGEGGLDGGWDGGRDGGLEGG